MRWSGMIGGLLVLVVFGCAAQRLAIGPPHQRVLQRDQLVIHTDFNLPRNHRLVEEITARRDDVTRTLDLPTSDESIHVYLFGSVDSFRGFMDKEYPTLPVRRAFFVETDTELTVYAYWGDRVAEDLRHEVVHGYLHAVVPNLPLWLDEGIAEYFEVPRGFGGFNQGHVELLEQLRQRDGWQPNLARLEGLETLGSMQQEDYAESWAWVHWLLRSTPENRDLLCDHLARLRMTGTAPPLSKVLGGPRGDELVRHLESLQPRR